MRLLTRQGVQDYSVMIKGFLNREVNSEKKIGLFLTSRLFTVLQDVPPNPVVFSPAGWMQPARKKLGGPSYRAQGQGTQTEVKGDFDFTPPSL